MCVYTLTLVYFDCMGMYRTWKGDVYKKHLLFHSSHPYTRFPLNVFVCKNHYRIVKKIAWETQTFRMFFFPFYNMISLFVDIPSVHFMWIFAFFFLSSLHLIVFLSYPRYFIKVMPQTCIYLSSRADKGFHIFFSYDLVNIIQMMNINFVNQNSELSFLLLHLRMLQANSHSIKIKWITKSCGAFTEGKNKFYFLLYGV